MTDQPTLRLNDGAAMPQFGLGLWRTPAEDAAAVVREAIAAGYRAVDTATVYGNEAGVGEGLDGHPDVFLTTKVWNSDQGFDATLRAFDRSAAALRRETIDLYLIHWPAPTKGLYLETWRALIRLKTEGRARSIGVSNFNPDHLQRIVGETGVVPAANQIELHPRFQRRDLRAFHATHGIATISWSPLGRARILDEPVLVEIAGKHGRTPAQVALRWHIDNGLVAIPKTVRPERLRENIAIFDFALDADDLERIDALDAADGRIGPDPMTATF